MQVVRPVCSTFICSDGEERYCGFKVDHMVLTQVMKGYCITEKGIQ